MASGYDEDDFGSGVADDSTIEQLMALNDDNSDAPSATSNDDRSNDDRSNDDASNSFPEGFGFYDDNPKQNVSAPPEG